MLANLPTEKISFRSDARPVSPDSVSSLEASIAEVGLINPIRVRAIEDGWEVVAGAHRLQAHRNLGLTEIASLVVDEDDLHAELAMIDENLMRAELSASERAQQTARRKAIYVQMHPDTAQYVAGAAAKHGRASDNLSFASDTAAATGKDKRTVQRDAERGEKVIPEVMEMIAGTKLDTGSYLDRIKNLTPNEQVIAAKRDLAHLRTQEREKDQTRTASKVQSDVKDRAAKEVAEIIAEHVPGDWWDGLKANLYAAGAANIANALTNITGNSIMDRRYG